MDDHFLSIIFNQETTRRTLLVVEFQSFCGDESQVGVGMQYTNALQLRQSEDKDMIKRIKSSQNMILTRLDKLARLYSILKSVET